MTAPGASPLLLGRVAELGRLDGALDEAMASGSRVVLCSGEAGVGKTALLRFFTDRAAERGATVLWPPAFGRPGAPPYWMWQQLAGPHRPFGSPLVPADRATLAVSACGPVAVDQRRPSRCAGAGRLGPRGWLLADHAAAGASRAGSESLLVCCAYESDGSTPGVDRDARRPRRGGGHRGTVALRAAGRGCPPAAGLRRPACSSPRPGRPGTDGHRRQPAVRRRAGWSPGRWRIGSCPSGRCR